MQTLIKGKHRKGTSKKENIRKINKKDIIEGDRERDRKKMRLLSVSL